MADGSWVATHENITELTVNRQIVDERISLQALIDWVPDYLWVKDTGAASSWSTGLSQSTVAGTRPAT